MSPSMVCHSSIPSDIQAKTSIFPKAQYDAHLRRQEADLRLFSEDESLILNTDIDYATVEGLSSEVRERLSMVRPTTIVRSHPTTYPLHH